MNDHARAATMPDFPMPLQQLLAEIDAVERDARALVEDLSDDQVNWQATPGRTWSIAQCLDHLRRINVFYMDALAPVVDRARQQGRGPFVSLRPGWLGRWFVRSLDPPPRLKSGARPQVVPASSLSKAEALEGFVRSHDAYRVFVAACAGIDTNRVTAPNPFFPMIRMTVSTALLVIPAHDRRHVWQARQVREKIVR